MTPAAALQKMDRRLLEAFSRRTVQKLRVIAPLRVVLPHLESFLEKNLSKEILKDALIIRHAYDSPTIKNASQLLFLKTKEIDVEFLKKIEGFLVRVNIPFEQIAPLRTRRIDLLLHFSDQVFKKWKSGTKIRNTFSKKEFERQLNEIFVLYVKETAILSCAIQLPFFLVPMRDWFSQELQNTMQEVALQLVREVSTAMYRRP
ncbi:conserved hypothetical protein [Gammaproteobacteria bacterium]